MYYFKVAVVFLACVGVTSSSSAYTLNSIYRDGKHCDKNFVSINTHRCTNSSGRRQCLLKWERLSIPSTHFQIKKIEKGQVVGLRCIQVDNNGVHYALKVIQSNRTLVFEEHRCSSATDEAFIFNVTYLRHRRTYTFQPIAIDGSMCIGATGDCSERPPLLIPSNSTVGDRKCRFIRDKK